MRNERTLSLLRRAGVLAAAAALALTSGAAEARPAYFEAFKAHYGIAPDSNLDACGVCHYRWTGTGARNDFGTAVEQQLYVGKSIVQSLQAIEAHDTDGDGFTNGDEIMTYMTLPGYSCSTFQNALLAPQGYDTFVTPMVATCLQPMDIRVAPSAVTVFGTVGKVKTYDVTLYNNGSTDPIEVSSVGFLPGAPPILSVVAPPTPFEIPVGGSQLVQIQFAPVTGIFLSATLRISSDDPDEPNVDVPFSGLAAVSTLAPGPQRAACFASIAKATSRYSKAHLKEWTRCYQEELAGRACNTGARDLRLAKAAEKFQASVGGSKDKACSGAGLGRASLGYADTCGGECSDLAVSTIKDVATCVMCVQDSVMQGLLRDGAGTAPPDLPPNVITDPDATSCQQRVLRDMQKGLQKIFSTLTSCEIAIVAENGDNGTCVADMATELAALRASVDASLDRCVGTSDMLGCRFEGMTPDPLCLGLATQSIGEALSTSVFGFPEEP